MAKDINIKGHEVINILMLGVIKFMRDNGWGVGFTLVLGVI